MQYREEIDVFLEKKSSDKKIIVIYGPTGAWKTDMSIDIAKYIDTEIISTDSRQIFQGMDIGTGKITLEEMKGVIHHMIDIVQPSETYSVWQFREQAQEVIMKLHWQQKIPLLVGWTGLYIDSLIYDWDWWGAPSDASVRQQIEKLSAEEVYKELQKVDPIVASEIHPNNVRRVQRALEIYRITWKSKKNFPHEKKLQYDTLFLTPYTWDREHLYNRINTRVEKMVKVWLVEEIQGLLKKGYNEDDFWMNSIGYQEFFPYFRGEISLEIAISKVQQNSRNYAKRQLTWFRNYVNN